MAKRPEGDDPGYRLARFPKGFIKVPHPDAPKVPPDTATRVDTTLPPPDDEALNKLRDRYKVEKELDRIGNFSGGRAWVSKGGQWWHIKEDGTKLSDERYDWVDSFSGGRARVKRGEQVWYIDLNGNRITDV